MKTKEEILEMYFDPYQTDYQSEWKDLQLAITLNPSLERIEQAMESYASQQTEKYKELVKAYDLLKEQIIKAVQDATDIVDGTVSIPILDHFLDGILNEQLRQLNVPSDEESQNHMIAMNLFQHKDEFGNDVWDEGKLHWAIQGYKIASKWMKDEIIKRNK
jgi:hypothetical protein